MTARQRVAITGASGLIGGALSSALVARGDEVVHLVRRPARTPSEVQWDPEHRQLPAGVLDGVTAVVNLAGANVGAKRWTPAYKRLILQSRVDSTVTVAEAVAAVDHPVRLLSSSAVGYYGDGGEQVLTESSPAGSSFLADVCRAWEAATDAAVAAGCAVALLRTGLVLAPGEGAMAPLLRLAPLGLAGPLGSGRQWWPWITLHDHVRAVLHLLDRPEITGPVNLVGPAPCRQRDLTTELGRALGRPAVLPAPSVAVRLAAGELADDVLASQRVIPEVLRTHGFQHEQRTVADAVRWVLEQR